MISVSEAEAIIAAQVVPAMARLGSEQVALPLAAGRILRQDVRAERDQPPFDRVMMDGIALSSRAWEGGPRSFPILATRAAGAGQTRLEDSQACIEVMTGAVLPIGCDCIVPVECIEVRDGVAHVAGDTEVKAGRFVHGQGSDRRAGAILLQPGCKLRAPEIAVLATAGLGAVSVGRVPSVAVVATGDELVEPGVPIEAGQVRRSNDLGLAAALALHGFGAVTRHHLLDDRAALAEALGKLLAANDVLVLSGGVSRGRYDYLPDVLAEVGVQKQFHRVAQQPGKPMWFGSSSNGSLVFALPGNPVSTLVSFYRYVLPALQAMMGANPARVETVTLAGETVANARLTRMPPVHLQSLSEGADQAAVAALNTSGDLLALAGTDGFVELPPQAKSYPAGTACRLHRWQSVSI